MTRKRKSVEMFQYQALRDVFKAGGYTVVKNFGEKFRELKVEGSRKKTVKTLYIRRNFQDLPNLKNLQALFMGTESGARQNFQDRRSYSRGRRDRRSTLRGSTYNRDRTRY